MLNNKSRARADARERSASLRSKRARVGLLTLAALAIVTTLLAVRRELVAHVADSEAVRELPRNLSSTPGFRGQGALPYAKAQIAGTVRASDGKPIAGARVCGSCASCGFVELPPSACVSTDDQGGYALEPTDPRPLWITAVAKGFNAGVANDGQPIALHGQAKSQVDVVLEAGGAELAGNVVDALGGPVAHARIQIVRPEIKGQQTIQVNSDEEGRFAASVSMGLVTLRVQAEGYAPALVHAVAPSHDVEVQLAPESQIRGRVVLASTGEPLAGAAVRAFPRGGNPRIAAALSDEHGEFTIREVEPGTYTLMAEHASARGDTHTPIAVGLADTVQGVVIEAVRAVSVFGRVVVPPGSPHCRGYVSLAAPSAASAALAKQVLSVKEYASDYNAVPNLSANIEADGTVSFRGVTPGRYHVTIQCIDQTLDDGPELLDVADRDLQVVWKARPGLGLVVRVVDAAGSPVPDARLTLLITRAGPDRAPVGMGFSVDRTGVGRVPASLYPGTYIVEADDGLEAQPVTVELRAGSGTTEVTLRVAGSGSILVDAQDDQGRPVNGLRVQAQAEVAAPIAPMVGTPPGLPAATFPPRIVGARALGAGKYQIGPLSAGSYTVSAEDSSNPPIRAEGPSGSVIHVTQGALLHAQLRVVRSGELRGSVVDAKGQPADNVWVTAAYQSEGSEGRPRRPTLGVEPLRAMTDQEGRFELGKLQPGAKYQLRVIEPHGAAVSLDGVSPGQDVRLVLPEPSVVSGVVLAANGLPPERFVVQAHHAATGLHRVGRVGTDGSFRIEGIPAGKVALTAEHPPSEFAQLEMELQGGEKRDGVRLQLTASAEPTTSGPM